MKGSPSDFSSQERALLPKEAEQKSLAENIQEIPSLQNEIENDFIMIEKEGSRLEKAALQTILKSLTKADLAKVNSFNDMIDLLHKIVPNQDIPKETFDELQKSFSDVLQSKKKSNYEFYLKLSLTLAGAAGAAYFGGPLAAIAARAIYTQAYSLLFGTPLWYQPSYWLVFMPGREHVGALAYKFGPAVVGTVAAPIFYGILNTAKYIGNKTYTAGEYLASIARGNLTEPLSAKDVESLIKAHEELEKDWVLMAEGDETQVDFTKQENDKENVEVKNVERRPPPLKVTLETLKVSKDESKMDIQQSPRIPKKK